MERQQGESADMTAGQPASRLVGQLAPLVEAHPDWSGFRLVEQGPEALVSRVRLADAASTSLDLQYYIAHDGLTTRLLVQRLLMAADRGVKVRVLLDALSGRGQEHQLARLDTHDNIEIRFFNPIPGRVRNALLRFFIFLFHIRRLHRRMHNKLWLADAVVGITGGRNLGDEYYGAAEDMNFADLDVLVAGPVAKKMQASFERYWHSASSVPLRAGLMSRPRRGDLRLLRLRLRDWLRMAARRRRDFVRQVRRASSLAAAGSELEGLRWAPGSLLVDEPEKIQSSEPAGNVDQLFQQLWHSISEVKKELVIVSAYFIPGEAGVALLRELVSRGVVVRILTNSLAATDLPLVHGGYCQYRRPLLEAGVQLYEMRARGGVLPRLARIRPRASLHSKALVFDQQFAFVGTFNMDPRSALWNTEMGVTIEDEVLAQQVYTLAGRGMAPTRSYRLGLDEDGRVVWHYLHNGKACARAAEPGGPWKRMLAWLARRFVPEDLL